MRKRVNLLLALAVVVIVTGAMGSSTVLGLPPSSGTPTPISPYYGTIVLATTYTPSGTSGDAYLYIFSSSGPFYVEKANVVVTKYGTLYKSVDLNYIFYDNGPGWYAHCAELIASSVFVNAGNIIPLVPSAMIDQTGATAIPAARSVIFDLEYNACVSTFPISLQLIFEVTIFAPISATVSICASESSALTSCSS